MSELTFRSEPPPDDEEDRQPIPFTLVVWRRTKDEGPVEETHQFTCLPRADVSGHGVQKVTLAADRGDVAAAAEAWRFFELVMEPDDLERLDALLNEKAVYVDAGVLIDASIGLFTEYAGRPTRPQRRSNGGPKTRGRTSTARRG